MKLGTAIAEIMKREGIEILCGYPVNHLIEHAANADIRPVMVRQERIGIHMADAISRVTSGQTIGAFCMQHGPGAENAMGGVAQCYGESVPVLVLPMGYARRLANIDPELQFQPGDEGVFKIVRADHPRQRSLQHLSPRLYKTEERPRRAGDRRNPRRHVERGSAGAAELHAGAAHPLWRRSRACEGSSGAAGRRQAAGDLCRPGRALRQGLAAAEASGRAARDPRHDKPRRQIVVSGRPIRCRSAPAASPCRARCRNFSAKPT